MHHRFLSMPTAIGVAEDLDIILSNIGLMLCEVNFYVVAKNTAVIWTFFWSIALVGKVRHIYRGWYVTIA